MKSEFEIAITQLSADRNLTPQVIMEAIQAALVSAYKRNFGSSQNVSVTLDSHTGQARVFVTKVVAEEAADERSEITLAEARTHDPDVEIGGMVDIEVKPRNFGRIAAQTAKQVITQRIREAERDSVYLEYADRVGEIINTVVRNVDSRSRNVMLSLGKAEAILPRSEQIPGEHYRFGQRLRAYIVTVERTGHGPQITASRTHRDLLRRLLELEVPEILAGTVEIKAIAREPGSRSKVGVAALQAGVDPVGSCVGMRGVRIQNIVNELNGEKIDVVAWASDLPGFVASALSPARVISVQVKEAENTARVVVPDRSLSLAIGKEGQNARLAAKLTGLRIDIKSEMEAAEEAERIAAEMAEEARLAQEREEVRKAAADLLAEAEALIAEEEAAEAALLAEVTAPVEEAVPEAEIDKDAVPEADSLEESVVEQAVEAEPVSELASVGEQRQVVAEDKAELETAEQEPLEEVAEERAAAVEAEEFLETEALEPPTEEESLKDEAAPEEWLEEEEADLEELDDEALDDDEEDPEERRRREANKNRGRILEYDEALGRVVARKQRKPGRSRGGWEDWDDE